MLSELFLKILDMSLSASWLVLAVIVARLVLRKAPKWVNVLLWGLVAVRLLCPFTPESSLSRVPDNDAMLSDWTDDYVGDIEIFHDNRAEFQTAVEAGRTPLYAGEDGYYVVTAPDKVSAPRTVGNTLVPALSVLWLLGMAAMGEYTLFSYWQLRRQVRLAIEVSEDVYLSEFIDTPFVLGLFRPRIYLPYHLSEQDSRHVIAHERTHIRRRDYWWKPLGFALLSVHWFNPVLWLAYCLLCRDIEMACDEKVVRELDPQQRADYSQALLNCSVLHHKITACPLAFGEVGVRERVQSVLHYKKPAAWMLLIAAAVCVVVAVCFLTEPRKPDSLEWLQTLNPSAVKYIEYINEQASPDKQYALYTDDALTEAVSYLHSFHGTPVREDSVEPVENTGYRLNIVTTSGSHTVRNIGNVYLVIDGDYYTDPNYILTQHFDDFFYGTSYLPAIENQEMNLSMAVEEVSSTGITIHFKNYATSEELALFGGNSYFLQEQVDGQWTDLPTLQDPVFTSDTYSLSSIARHQINWEWLYGRLPAGHYRIGKKVSVLSPEGISYQSHVVYAEFTIAGDTDDWNLKLNLGWFTASGIHCEIDISGAGAGEEFYYSGAELYPDQADAAPYTTATDASSGPQNLLENPEVTILWQDNVPAGNYRAEIQILRVSPSGEEEIRTYSVYLGISGEGGYMSPLVVTQKLTADGLSGSAEYLNAGGGYNFFQDMTEEIVAILNELTSQDILPSPGIIPDTVIALRSQELSIILHSDGEYVEFSFEGKQAVTIGNGIWAVKNQALNDFFAMINSFSPENSTYEIYNVAPLDELPKHYNLEEASIDQVVITENGIQLANAEVWAEFWDATRHHIPASVRCMNISESSSDIYDIEFDGGEYHYRTMRNGELWDISYRYLLFFSGDAPENADYDAFEYFVLVNDSSVTWEQIQRSYISSQSADEVDHRIVLYHHIYYPKQPQLPDAVQAELVVNGETIALAADEKTVYEIHRLINGGQWLGYEPKTHFLGPQLMLLGEDGTAYSVVLDVTDDLCRIGDRFYDYGPGMDGEASVNNLPKLLELFGLEDWPEGVKALHPYLWE